MSSGEEPLEPAAPLDGSVPAPPKKRLSRAMKTLLFALAGGGLVVVSCCGLAGINASRLFKASERAAMQSPEETREAVRRIAEIDLPERFTPLMAIDVPLTPAFLGRVGMAGHDVGGGRGSLYLFQLPVPVADSQPVVQIVRQKLVEAGSDSGDRLLRDLSVDENESKPMRIRDDDATVFYSAGKDQRTGERFREAAVAFPGRPGTTFVLLQLAEDEWDDDEVARILESIR